MMCSKFDTYVYWRFQQERTCIFSRRPDFKQLITTYTGELTSLYNSHSLQTHVESTDVLSAKIEKQRPKCSDVPVVCLDYLATVPRLLRRSTGKREALERRVEPLNVP
jgi:hypothetical protein